MARLDGRMSLLLYALPANAAAVYEHSEGSSEEEMDVCLALNGLHCISHVGCRQIVTASY